MNTYMIFDTNANTIGATFANDINEAIENAVREYGNDVIVVSM